MVSSHKLYCMWPAYYKYADGCLYVKQCDMYVQYSPDKEDIHLFVNCKDSKWIPMDTSAPAHIQLMDGMATVEKVDCSGVVGDVQVQQDGTFQTYLDFLDDLES
eukprot:8850623-Ditylum_brightwellii.AAC.1